MLWQVILHGRQVHFQHSYSLLELAFSLKKPRCWLYQTLSSYFINATFVLFTKTEISKSCYSLTPTYLYVFMFFQEGWIMSRLVLVFLPLLLAVSFLQERFEHSIIIMMTDFNFTPWSSSPKCPLFILPYALGYLSFHSNTDLAKNVWFLEISHNFWQMMWDKMGWKRNRNEGQNDIYYLAIRMRLSRIWRVKQIAEGVIHRGRFFCRVFSYYFA